MFTYIARDIQGNWFLSRWKFATEQLAEEESASLAEYDFIREIRIVRMDGDELKTIKTYLN